MLSGRILLAGKNWSEEMRRVRNILLPFCFDFASQPTKYFATDVSFFHSKQYTCSDRFKVKLSCGGGAMLSQQSSTTIKLIRQRYERRYSFRHC